jgi:hypothetical protein
MIEMEQIITFAPSVLRSILRNQNPGVLWRYQPLRVMLINTHPSPHLLQIPNIIFSHTDVGLEEIAEGVEGGCHRIYDDMGCFVEEETGFFVVGKVVGQTQHSSISVATHSGKVIY